MPIKQISGCIGCEACVKSCPTDVIHMNKLTNKAEIRYPEDCQICHLCRLYCPVGAITITPDKSIPVMVSWR
ncbi:4Fe-4S dicluster domain-containing protein [Shewanella ulleungensis]|jgi:NAD-dependent dihydropyrimidine dehydrogenase PreA subunit|uniref:[Fe-S]-binding protein n=1 Tax=Shewanella ulleungensis TaxID=2282699 RepID=A0ABQ2QEU6_9GAMM|nr:4Fe-4S binding protein [Shewanella ulleungensis]MCL1148695.1 4Fe-4S binding protein [Shewanella ulleungensis]GGP76165.1 [Fe-S]-binding protein [Shewanella ulleungensis]